MANAVCPTPSLYFATIARLAHTAAAKLALADYYSIAKRPEEARKMLQELAGDAPHAMAAVRLAALDAAEGHRAQAQDRLRELLQEAAEGNPPPCS